MATTATTSPSVYNADDLQVLDDIAPIRLRPAMYIGSASENGLHHLLSELLFHPVECFVVGECRSVEVCLFADGRCSIVEDARPFSVTRTPASDLTEVETLFTRWLCGGWVHDFLVVNALSDSLTVEVRAGGRRYGFSAARGVLTSRLADLGPATECGNTITFRPDPEIFGTHTFDAERLAERLKQLAYLNPGLRLSLEVEATGKRQEFSSLNGLADYVREMTQHQTPIHDVIHFQRTVGEVVIEVALQWGEVAEAGAVICFMNGAASPHGGTPVYGLHRGVKKCLLRFSPSNAAKDFKSEDFRDDLTAIVAVQHPDPQWLGATKSEVNNPELEPLVARVVDRELGDYLSVDDDLTQRLWERCDLARRARLAAREVRTRLRGRRRQTP